MHKDTCSWLWRATEKNSAYPQYFLTILKWDINSEPFTFTGKTPVNLLLFHNSDAVNSYMLSLTGCWVCRIFPRSLLQFSHSGKRGVIMINSLFMKCFRHVVHLYHVLALPLCSYLTQKQSASIFFELWQFLIKLCSTKKLHWVTGISFSSSRKGIFYSNNQWFKGALFNFFTGL